MAGCNRSRRVRTKTKHYTDDDPCTFTTKLKKGDKCENQSSVRHDSNVERQAAKKRPRSPKKAQVIPPPEPPPFTCLSHYVRVAPIFLPVEPPHSVVNGLGLGILPPLKTPTWQALPQPTVTRSHESEAKSDIQKAPITCTCIAINETYIAMGDTAGFVSLYAISPRILIVARLTTSASIRESEDQEGLPPTKKFGLYQKKNHPNQVEKVALTSSAKHLLILATRRELELLDVISNSTLWTISIELQVHALHIHPYNGKVLCSFASELKCESQIFSSNTTPLWQIETIQGKPQKMLVLPITKEGEKLVLGNRCAAIWDKSKEDSLLMVTLVSGKDELVEQELLQLNCFQFEIHQRLTVPNKFTGKSSYVTVEAISQSPSGHMTLVSSTKGIQLIETATFQIIRVFGDSVSLHGNSLMFQQACYIPKSSTTFPRCDFENYQKEKDDTFNDAWILGVPYANREPREFRDSLHLWDFGDGKNTVAIITGPPRSEGFFSVESCHNHLLVTTQSGNFYGMMPTIKSDFAGIMYPPGYQLINDNVEYIEDEDEVDVEICNVEVSVENDEGQVFDIVADDEVAGAMRLSMVEHQVPNTGTLPCKEELIDVIGCIETNPSYLPCIPEPHLRHDCQVDSESLRSFASSDMVESCGVPAFFKTSVMQVMPHLQVALESKKCMHGIPPSDESKLIQKVMRTKRSKAASLEALFKSSLDQDLRRIMVSKQAWENGSGSHLRILNENHDLRSKVLKDANDNYEEQNSGACGNEIVVLPFDEGFKSEQALKEIKQPEAGIAFSESIKFEAATALLLSASEIVKSPTLHDGKDSCLQTGNASVNMDMNLTNNYTILRENSSNACLACRGRFVYHTCKKKEIPVDYQEIMRADEERKEKEEEEKRKVRAEKRRLADAKRREARKKKKMEEETKNRLDEMSRVRDEKDLVLSESDRLKSHFDDKDRRRAEMLFRLKAEQERASCDDWPQTIESQPSVSAYYEFSKPKMSGYSNDASADQSHSHSSHISSFSPDRSHIQNFSSQQQLSGPHVASRWPQSLQANQVDNTLQAPVAADGFHLSSEGNATPQVNAFRYNPQKIGTHQISAEPSLASLSESNAFYSQGTSSSILFTESVSKQESQKTKSQEPQSVLSTEKENKLVQDHCTVYESTSTALNLFSSVSYSHDHKQSESSNQVISPSSKEVTCINTDLAHRISSNEYSDDMGFKSHAKSNLHSPVNQQFFHFLSGKNEPGKLEVFEKPSITPQGFTLVKTDPKSLAISINVADGRNLPSTYTSNSSEVTEIQSRSLISPTFEVPTQSSQEVLDATKLGEWNGSQFCVSSMTFQSNPEHFPVHVVSSPSENHEVAPVCQSSAPRDSILSTDHYDSLRMEKASNLNQRNNNTFTVHVSDTSHSYNSTESTPSYKDGLSLTANSKCGNEVSESAYSALLDPAPSGYIAIPESANLSLGSYVHDCFASNSGDSSIIDSSLTSNQKQIESDIFRTDHKFGYSVNLGVNENITIQGTSLSQDNEEEGVSHLGSLTSRYEKPILNVTKELLDPAEALASLAMFATAASMVEKYDNTYNGIGQFHHQEHLDFARKGHEDEPLVSSENGTDVTSLSRSLEKTDI